jgi:hypothetical protein
MRENTSVLKKSMNIQNICVYLYTSKPPLN